MGNTLILGPDKTCHVVCHDWTNQLVLFQRNGKLYCNSNAEIEVDGKKVTGQNELTMDSRVSGADFAVTLEQIQGFDGPSS